MQINLKTTLENSKKNITKATLSRSLFRKWQTINNYANRAVNIPKNINTALIQIFEDNGDEVFYIDSE